MLKTGTSRANAERLFRTVKSDRDAGRRHSPRGGRTLKLSSLTIYRGTSHNKILAPPPSLQQVLQIAAEDAQRPVPLQAFVEDAVSICTIFAGESRCLVLWWCTLSGRTSPLNQAECSLLTEA